MNEEKQLRIKKVVLATNIPFVFVISPALGFFLGRGIETLYSGAKPIASLIGIFFGLVIAVYEAIVIAKKIENLSNKKGSK